MKKLQLLFAALLLFVMPLGAATFTSNAPTTTNNDDSCDISLLPAATLLLPYFEVNLGPAGAETTIITITNTGQLPQAVTVTLWTDYGFPVINFPIFLTGYDVQSINLYDIIRRGRIAPDNGTGLDVSPVGRLSGSNELPHDNPNLTESTCTNLPVQLPQIYITRMQSAFTTGKVPAIGATSACNNAGGTHTNAVGYATIDVVGACTASLPTDPPYFGSEIRFDNVLMGDYLQVDGTNNFAQGSPMVHIRAIPEGGNQNTHGGTNFRRTFYSRYQPAATPTRDGRQPLPSTFAARFIEGGATGFQTFYKIWREVETPGTFACSAYTRANAVPPVTEVVRFDEEENPSTVVSVPIDPVNPPPAGLAATNLLAVTTSDVIPPNVGGDVAGWIYFNLHNKRAGDASQNWVVTSMRAENRFSADMDALALGNGCTQATPVTNANQQGAQPIGPASNANP